MLVFGWSDSVRSSVLLLKSDGFLSPRASAVQE